MVRRSSTTSRGTTYWFPCFCLAMSRLSGLRMRNFSDFDVLTKIKRRKGNKATKERTSSIPDPSLRGFQHGGGLKADNTLSATKLSFKLQSKNLWLNKETFLLYNVINAKEASYETRAIKAPQSEPRTRKNKKRR